MSNTQWPTLPAYRFKPGQCSAAIVVPRQRFRRLVEEAGLLSSMYEEEGGLFIIPRMPQMGSMEGQQEFLRFIKPKLLRLELRRFPDLEPKFAGRLTATVFDDYFRLKLRDEVNDIRELWPPGSAERSQAGT